MNRLIGVAKERESRLVNILVIARSVFACVLVCSYTLPVKATEPTTIGMQRPIPPKYQWRVKASSIQNDQFIADFVADGDIETRWSSKPSDPEWLQIDLGSSADIAGFTLHWEDAYSSEYRISVSADSEIWTQVYEARKSDGQVDDIYINPVKGRFVRLDGLQRATGWGHSVWEIDIKGNSERVTVTENGDAGGDSSAAMDGNHETVWESSEPGDTELKLDFGISKPLRGLRIDWGVNFAKSAALEVSIDGLVWQPAAAMASGRGKFDVLAHDEQSARYVKLRLSDPVDTNHGIQVREIRLRGSNEVYTSLMEYQGAALKASPGHYPMHLRGQQTYWTLVGLPHDNEESLFDEYGNLEPTKDAATLMPYVYINGELRSAVDAGSITHNLVEEYLPLPSVGWEVQEGLEFTAEAITLGPIESSTTYVRYTLNNVSNRSHQGTVYAAVRPIQINPKWQHGGLSPINELSYTNSPQEPLEINGKPSYIPLTPADSFAAVEFQRGDIVEYIAAGRTPTATISEFGAKLELKDVSGDGLLSAAWAYDFQLSPGERKQIMIAAPLHDTLDGLEHFEDFDQHRSDLAVFWQEKIDRVGLDLADKEVANTVKSQLAYILLNQDGVVIQPGSRNYDRTWMRDGAMTSSTLMRLGLFDEAKQYIEWYAGKVKPNGLVPPILYSGGDAYKGWGADIEWDSQGQFIYAVMEYYRFTGDGDFLRRYFDAIHGALRFLVFLREQTLHSNLDDPALGQRTIGILPPSISHEGFSTPAFSYWDDFWAIRGWQDGIAAARILGQSEIEQWADEHYRKFVRSLQNSIASTIAWGNLSHVPSDADTGSGDPTSLAIALFPTIAGHTLPMPLVKKTFSDYYDMVLARHSSTLSYAYTPYEVRNILALAILGDTAKAYDIHELLFSDRRPAGWNQFAEVVHSDPRKGAYIGDMPHTWVGSGYVNSVRGLIVMEDDENNILNLLFATPKQWLQEEGIELRNLPTHFGPINMQATWQEIGQELKLRLTTSGNTANRIYVRWPVLTKGRPAEIEIEGDDDYEFNEDGIWFSKANFSLRAKW